MAKNVDPTLAFDSINYKSSLILGDQLANGPSRPNSPSPGGGQQEIIIDIEDVPPMDEPVKEEVRETTSFKVLRVS